MTRKTVGSISSKKSRKGEIKGVRNIEEKAEQFEKQKNDFCVCGGGGVFRRVGGQRNGRRRRKNERRKTSRMNKQELKKKKKKAKQGKAERTS